MRTLKAFGIKDFRVMRMVFAFALVFAMLFSAVEVANPGLFGVVEAHAGERNETPDINVQTITVDENTSDKLMNGIIGWILDLVRYVGIGILIWGVVEIVLSFTQDMPDKKIKGITLAFSGVMCIALKSVLNSIL